MGGGMSMGPTLWNNSSPGRYELMSMQIVPTGGQKPQPIILKLDTQTGQVWKLQAQPGQPGLRFVVTGRLTGFSRSEIQGMIKDHGGAVGSSVTGKTDYLVAGADPGSKLADAERLDVKVIDDEELLGLIDGA